MADNTTLSAMTGGDVIGTDDVGGVKYQRIKVGHGADGSYTDASATAPLPATLTAKDVVGTATTTIQTDSIPSTDAGGYSLISIRFTGSNNQNAYQLQASNDGVNWSSQAVMTQLQNDFPQYQLGQSNWMTASPTALFTSPVLSRYVRVRLVSYTASTSNTAYMTLHPTAVPAVTFVQTPSGMNMPVTVASVPSGWYASNAVGAGSQLLGAGVMGWDGSANYVRLRSNSSGHLQVQTAGASSFGSAKATVTTAGTAVVLGTNACSSVTVKARAANTGLIYVGNNSAVSAANGFDLSPGETVSLDVNNTNQIYVNAATSGDQVSYVWVA